MPRTAPEPASVEDYDSDISAVKRNTRKDARRKTISSAPPPKTLDRYRHSRKHGSDSGYSSHTSGTQASYASASAAAAVAAMPPPPRPATVHPQSKPKPIIHRSESQRSKSKEPSRSASTSRQSSACGDPNCRDPNCPVALAKLERRKSVASQPYAPQYAASPVQYRQQVPQQQVPQYQYQYAQVPQVSTAQTVPTLVAQPQPRSGSASRQARPVSIHGYSYASSYNTTQPGPSSANPAYPSEVVAAAWAQYYQQLQQIQQQQAYQQASMAAYGTTPPNPATPVYTQASPVLPSPTSPNHPPAPNYTSAPGLQRTYSARAAPGYPAYDVSKAQAQAQTLSRTTSARQPSARAPAMPGSFPRETPESSETDSSSEDSESEISEEEYQRARSTQARAIRAASASSQRRPSMPRQYVTAPAVPQMRPSREPIHRSLRSDTLLDYISSSDNHDSDRTARAVVDRRTTYSGSTKSSRRPSVSTTASSGRTKSTNPSSLTSGMASLVIEGKSGRRIAYLSKRDQDALYRRYTQQQVEEQQQRREDEIVAYQDYVRGSPVPELTADTIRQHQMRSSSSRVSGHSHKSSRASSKANNDEGIKIESGGTIIHVYGGSKIEMKPGEDGGPAQFVIGSASGGNSKDSAYHSSSKSSSSRVERSHGNSDVGRGRRDTIIEENV